VLIPTYRDDPSALLKALDERGADAEIVLLDDGGGDADLTRRMAARIEKLNLPARLIVLSSNEGRAKGRNRLALHARGRHLLFLDSDMLPDPKDFLTRWAAVAADDVAVAFGGFTLNQTPPAPSTTCTGPWR
jgi:glycosyltransferase involved in cell wall biosynthesis